MFREMSPGQLSLRLLILLFVYNRHFFEPMDDESVASEKTTGSLVHCLSVGGRSDVEVILYLNHYVIHPLKKSTDAVIL